LKPGRFLFRTYRNAMKALGGSFQAGGASFKFFKREFRGAPSPNEIHEVCRRHFQTQMRDFATALIGVKVPLSASDRRGN
jgi:hypothetical protein